MEKFDLEATHRLERKVAEKQSQFYKYLSNRMVDVKKKIKLNEEMSKHQADQLDQAYQRLKTDTNLDQQHYSNIFLFYL